ncbi:MAG: cobalamin biosynthesis protein [Candidatus Nezhaarchaeota archaeon]|nr:cobalamin biosynthesis protein [Candidatus Nezhaarchaeota archaeon]
MERTTICLVAEVALLCTSFAFDKLLGDPPSKYHPVVWIGWLIGKLKFLNKGSSRRRRFLGVLVALTVVAAFSLPVFLLLNCLMTIHLLAYILIGGLIFKFTFAFRSLSDYTRPIAEALKKGNLEEARRFIPFIARRDPSKLSSELIASAAVESIAESTVDGITSPLLYFSLFGVPGACAFRAVNTLDSMLGYKTSELKDFGWFSARLDTALNFLTSRITALIMVLTAKLLGLDARNGLKIALRDHSKTESLNAGWPMSTMAGILGVRLVKQGFYELGDPLNPLQPDHILKAIKVMRMTVLLYVIIICLPLLTLRCMIISSW